MTLSMSNGGPSSNLVLHGIEDKKRAKSLRSRLLPRHPKEGPLANCEWAFFFGDKYSREGHFGLAEGYYRLVHSFLKDLLNLSPRSTRARASVLQIRSS